MEKLSWEDTAREMAASGEDWSAWETTDEDGINELPWQVEEEAPCRRTAGAMPCPIAAQEAPMKRYEIRWVILDPARGTGMAKTRQAVIVSLDI